MCALIFSPGIPVHAVVFGARDDGWGQFERCQWGYGSVDGLAELGPVAHSKDIAVIKSSVNERLRGALRNGQDSGSIGDEQGRRFRVRHVRSSDGYLFASRSEHGRLHR